MYQFFSGGVVVWVWDCIAGEFYETNGDHVTADTVNSLNRLTVATSPAGKVEFTYDYTGRRVEKKVFQLSSGTFQLVKTERFVYDGFKQIEKLDGGNSNAVLQKITWQPERLGQDVPLSIVAVNSDSTTMNYYYFTDANKNVGQLMDASGNIVAKYEYSPFGEVIAQSGAYADANAFRFSSEYADAETGLVYYNYRYYYPMMGRWISRDPIGEKGENNLYEMLNNDTVTSIDKLGLLSVLQALTWNINGAPSKDALMRDLCVLRHLGMNTNSFTSDAYFSLQKIIATGSVLFGTTSLPDTGGEYLSIDGQPSMIIDNSLAGDLQTRISLMMHEGQHDAHYVMDLFRESASTYQVQQAVVSAYDAAAADFSTISCCKSGQKKTIHFSRLQQIKHDCGMGPGPCEE